MGTEDDLEQWILGIRDTKQKLFVTARSPEREADGGKPCLPYEGPDWQEWCYRNLLATFSHQGSIIWLKGENPEEHSPGERSLPSLHDFRVLCLPKSSCSPPSCFGIILWVIRGRWEKQTTFAWYSCPCIFVWDSLLPGKWLRTSAASFEIKISMLIKGRTLKHCSSDKLIFKPNAEILAKISDHHITVMKTGIM